MRFITFLSLFCSVAAIITGLVGFYGFGLETDAGWWLQRACWLMLGMAFAVPAIVVTVHYAIGAYWTLILMNERPRRSWGHAIGGVGFLFFLLASGEPTDPNVIWPIIVFGLIGLSLIGMGWLVNHWPPPRGRHLNFFYNAGRKRV